MSYNLYEIVFENLCFEAKFFFVGAICFVKNSKGKELLNHEEKLEEIGLNDDGQSGQEMVSG